MCSWSVWMKEVWGNAVLREALRCIIITHPPTCHGARCEICLPFWCSMTVVLNVIMSRCLEGHGWGRWCRSTVLMELFTWRLGEGRCLCRSTGLLQPPHFLMFLCSTCVDTRVGEPSTVFYSWTRWGLSVVKQSWQSCHDVCVNH